MSVLVPVVIEQTPNGERSYDIYSRLLKDNIVFLGSGFDDQMANSIISQLLFLDNQNPGQPIRMYINSPGGSVYSGLGIYSTMQAIKSPVHTIVLGLAASMGSFIANAGEAGHRYVLTESTTMVHRVSSGTRGTSGTVHEQDLQFEDAKRSHEETHRLNKRLTEIYAKHNSKGKTYEEFHDIMKYDTYLSPEDAVNLGVADKIIDSI